MKFSKFSSCGLAGIAVGTVLGVQAHAQSTVEELQTFFAPAQIVSGPDIVNCTLSGGSETTCFSITVIAEPSSYIPGPWCPTKISDGSDKSGIWLEGGEAYSADGAFMQNMSTFYEDDKWQLFDRSTGKINVTDSLESCLAAARPDVDPAYQNHCVQCLMEYIPDGATQTYVIPVEPQPLMRGRTLSFAGAGIASNGVSLAAAAPTDAILGAYTIAPFDTCGGHVNVHAGYHYHAVTDCLTELSSASQHGVQIGIAMDGYKIFAHNLTDGSLPTKLDRCNGHEVEGLNYHYHAGAVGSNAILGCMSAEYGCASNDPTAVCDASARPPRP
ncbi:YHYH protein [uncultured Sulfitobacter sp.]|uniref:YHYH protein n=1 Tax=uncultured Sulfitobacter sp. TaxID=191468 RepID=UPI002614B81A|nr:YHYH protein [uncultured Sulfitobacter sp.]